ncbi:MAG: cysteine peptidase family C39 domain-containing protein, partial [Desulfobacterales bacterium]
MNTGLIALEVVARINRIDVDIRAVTRQFGIHDEVTPEELVRIAKHFGFRARIKNIPAAKVAGDYPLPAIVVEKSGAYRVLLKANDGASRLLLFDPEARKTTEAGADDVAAATAAVILLSHRKVSSQTVFGFRWFFAEMSR